MGLAVKPLNHRISTMVDKLIEDEEVFKEINKTKPMEALSELTENFSDRKLASISDHELRKRLKDIMSIEAMSGLIKDFNPEQVEIFDEAVKRREFF